MNIKTMLKRENFYEVFFDSIKDYFRTVHGSEIEISDKDFDKSKKFYLHYFLSFAGQYPLSKNEKKHLYSEYNIRGNFLKYIVGKMLVFVVTNSYGLLADSKFYISKVKGLDNNLFIQPCNRSVRFYYFDKGYVDCITKRGYRNDFLANQVKYRLTQSYDFVPKVLDHGEDWYREEIMYGNPLVRVKNEGRYQEGIENVLSYLKVMAEDSLKYLKVLEYYSSIKDEIFYIINDINDINDIKDIKDDDTGDITRIFEEYFDVAKGVITNSNLSIPLVISHGDLQGGNIWVTRENKTLIYDWETVGYRTIWYDLSVFFYNMRSITLQTDIENKLHTDKRIFQNDPKQGYTDDEIKVISQIIFLEDLLFYVKDIYQLPKANAREHLKNIGAILANKLNSEG